MNPWVWPNFKVPAAISHQPTRSCLKETSTPQDSITCMLPSMCEVLYVLQMMLITYLAYLQEV